MTEKQIIERIRTLSDVSEIREQIRKLEMMRDQLHAVREGSKQAARGWLNSSPTVFPEDFEDEMSGLHADLASSDILLTQLERIEAALKEQEQKVIRR
jgi:hypothetical protein